MNVDKFGHHMFKKRLKEMSTLGILPGTDDGNLDAQYKLIKNVKSPIELHDAATKGYVEERFKEYFKKLSEINQKHLDSLKKLEILNIKADTLDLAKRSIKNLSDPIDLNDAVTKKYVDDSITKYTKSLTQLVSEISEKVSSFEKIRRTEKDIKKK